MAQSAAQRLGAHLLVPRPELVAELLARLQELVRAPERREQRCVAHALRAQAGRRGTQVGPALERAQLQGEAARLVPCVGPPRVLAEHLHQAERLHAAPQPRGAEHGRGQGEAGLRRGPPLLGGVVGRPAGHCGRRGHRHQGGPAPVPRLRGPPGFERRVLGLEPGRQPPAARRRQPGQLPAPQQRTQVPGWGADSGDPGLRGQHPGIRAELPVPRGGLQGAPGQEAVPCNLGRLRQHGGLHGVPGTPAGRLTLAQAPHPGCTPRPPCHLCLAALVSAV